MAKQDQILHRCRCVCALATMTALTETVCVASLENTLWMQDTRTEILFYGHRSQDHRIWDRILSSADCFQWCSVSGSSKGLFWLRNCSPSSLKCLKSLFCWSMWCCGIRLEWSWNSCTGSATCVLGLSPLQSHCSGTLSTRFLGLCRSKILWILLFLDPPKMLFWRSFWFCL